MPGANVKKIWVSLPSDAWAVVEKLRGPEMGADDSAVLKEIVLSYMRDKELLRDRKLLDEFLN